MSALIAVTLLLSLLVEPMEAPPQYGTAKHYSPGVFKRVYNVRVRQGLIRPRTPWGDGLASTTECANIGRRAVVQLWDPVRRRWGPVRFPLIVDCSDPTKKRQRDGRYESDRDRHIREGLLVEVNYAMAEEGNWEWNGYRGRGRTKVLFYGVR